ncbi:L,D-transpeptidase family protein [Methylobacter sp.]|uniref:L,D-transpeptidase family protein n=1 Tax=Methylobacter sp. TaxID=2051955 RepID=UPI003DA4E543
MKLRILFALSIALSVIGGKASATTYNWPADPNDTVITEYPDGVPLARAEQEETLLDMARRFNLGQMEIVRLNPDVDRWHVKKDEIIRISNRRILPDSPHKGITLNISEYRMYFYPPQAPGMPRQVMSFAHGVGRQDWKTPLGETKVARKVKDPVWHPPESIRREHAANGDPLPAAVPAGPHNPLGAYALYLNLPGEYRIHGTDIDKIFGIGMQITHGCVRMYPEDIEQLYYMVPVGTPVYIVKQPIKVGWLDNKLYIEAHPDLEGEEMTRDQRFELALSLIQKANNGEIPEFDQQILNEALTKLDGDPIAIYERLPPMPDEEAITAQQEPVQTPASNPTLTKYYRGPQKPPSSY